MMIRANKNHQPAANLVMIMINIMTMIVYMMMMMMMRMMKTWHKVPMGRHQNLVAWMPPKWTRRRSKRYTGSRIWWIWLHDGHHESPVHGQAVIFLTGLLALFLNYQFSQNKRAALSVMMAMMMMMVMMIRWKQTWQLQRYSLLRIFDTIGRLFPLVWRESENQNGDSLSISMNHQNGDAIFLKSHLND